MTPLPDAWLAQSLTRLDAAIAREIGRLRARYELSLDELRGLYVSDAQVDALLRDVSPELNLAVLAPSTPPPAGTRWAQLAHSLALGSDELDLMTLALATGLDNKYDALLAYLNNDVSRKWATPELALRLFGHNSAHQLQLRQRLAPEAPLMALGVLDVVPSTREAPRWQRGLRVNCALADWLLGLAWQDERLTGVVRCVHAPARTPAPAPAATRRAALDAAAVGASDPHQALMRSVAQRRDAHAPVLIISAPSAADAVHAAQAGLAGSAPSSTVVHDPSLGQHNAAQQLLLVDLLALRAHSAPLEAVAALALMQRSLALPLLASPMDALADPDGRPLDAPCTALRRLAHHVRPLLLCASSGQRWRDMLGDVRTVEIVLPELDVQQRLQAWREALQADGDSASGNDTSAITHEITHNITHDDALLTLADRFVLGTERVHRAVQHAQDLQHSAAQPGHSTVPNAEQLFAAARALSLEGNSEVVRCVRQQFSWSDLVLPKDLQQRLRDLVHAVALRPQVFDRWNFAQPGGGQRGIKAMFAGPSGTGKTMAAAIVARELGLELHRVELAAVMSKYIGETEKNLDRAFAAARRANAILFIDEADALLGKRAETKDAHDRYANVEVAFLLQKMEDHDGVVIIATNLAHNIDAAFSRRMQFVLQFPLPDTESRERLWQAMFPPQAPRAKDLDISFLARQFEFAGGDIRNITLEAAFRSAHQGCDIGMREVLGAVVAHYAKRGKLPSANEFGHYAGVFARPRPGATVAPENKPEAEALSQRSAS